MWNQTVTLYHKGYDGDHTTWTRRVLHGVFLCIADGQGIGGNGFSGRGGSILRVRRAEDTEQICNGDYVVPGACPVNSFSGQATKELANYGPMRVSGRKCYPFASSMAHNAFTLDGAAK